MNEYSQRDDDNTNIAEVKWKFSVLLNKKHLQKVFKSSKDQKDNSLKSCVKKIEVKV